MKKVMVNKAVTNDDIEKLRDDIVDELENRGYDLNELMKSIQERVSNEVSRFNRSTQKSPSDRRVAELNQNIHSSTKDNAKVQKDLITLAKNKKNIKSAYTAISFNFWI